MAYQGGWDREEEKEAERISPEDSSMPEPDSGQTASASLDDYFADIATNTRQYNIDDLNYYSRQSEKYAPEETNKNFDDWRKEKVTPGNLALTVVILVFAITVSVLIGSTVYNVMLKPDPKERPMQYPDVLKKKLW